MSRRAQKEPNKTCSRSLRPAASSRTSRDQKIVANDLDRAITIQSLWTDFGLGVWRHEGKEKKRKREKNSISEYNGKDDGVWKWVSSNEARTNVTYNGKYYITTGAANNNGVIIGNISMKKRLTQTYKSFGSHELQPGHWINDASWPLKASQERVHLNQLNLYKSIIGLIAVNIGNETDLQHPNNDTWQNFTQLSPAKRWDHTITHDQWKPKHPADGITPTRTNYENG